MYCKKCGNKLNEGDVFCPSCGSKTVTANSNKEIKAIEIQSKDNQVQETKRKNPGVLTGLLIGVGGILIICLILTVTGIISVGKGTKNSRSSADGSNLEDMSEGEDLRYELKAEGSGYESGEKALGAYLHYFHDQDVDGMISCFAVESFCEEVDFKKHTERMQAYMPYSYFIMPVFGGFSKDIFIKRRIGDVSKEIYRQYLALAAPRYVNGENAGWLIRLEDYNNDVDRMVDQLFDYTDDKQFKAEFSFEDRFADPYLLTDYRYGDERNIENMKRIRDTYEAQDYESVVAEFEFGGTTYLMCADVIEYGEKWYLYSLGGNVGSLLGIDAYHSGIVEKQYAGIIREAAPAATEAAKAAPTMEAAPATEDDTKQVDLINSYTYAIADADENRIKLLFDMPEGDFSLKEKDIFYPGLKQGNWKYGGSAIAAYQDKLLETGIDLEDVISGAELIASGKAPSEYWDLYGGNQAIDSHLFYEFADTLRTIIQNNNLSDLYAAKTRITATNEQLGEKDFRFNCIYKKQNNGEYAFLAVFPEFISEQSILQEKE